MRNVGIEHLLLYFVLEEGYSIDDKDVELLFAEKGTEQSIGGSTKPSDAAMGTHKSETSSWLTMIGKNPAGE